MHVRGEKKVAVAVFIFIFFRFDKDRVWLGGPIQRRQGVPLVGKSESVLGVAGGGPSRGGRKYRVKRGAAVVARRKGKI